MGNKKDPNAPLCNWTPPIELKFLTMLHDFVLSKSDRRTINPDWNKWCDILATDFGHPVTPLQLRSKKERFKTNWDAYKYLQSSASLAWDPVKKTVSCPSHEVDSFKQNYKGASYVLKNGLDHVHMYEVIFDSRHAARSLTLESNITTLPSDPISRELANGGAAAAEELDGARHAVDGESRSSHPGVSGRSHGVSKKRIKNHKAVDAQAAEALKMIAHTISARYLTSSKSSTEVTTGRSLLVQCQDIMEAMSVDNDLYFRALEFFKTDKDWCEVFINMSSERRSFFLSQKLTPTDPPAQS